MPSPDESSEVISSSVRAVLGARSAQEAVEGMAVILQGRYGLCRIALWRFTAGKTAKLLAQWGSVEQAIKPGDELAIDLTPTVQELASLIIKGEPFALDPRGMDLGLLGTVLVREGERSIAAVPVEDDVGAPVAALAFSSTEEQAFDSADIAILSAIGHGAGRALLSLADA